ncbi:Tbingi protein, partial [Trypanosoma cruzi]
RQSMVLGPASPTPHCTPDPAQYQASKIVTRTPRGSKLEDAVFEAKLQPPPRCETRGDALRFIASIVRHPQHPARKPHGFIMALRPALRTKARCPRLPRRCRCGWPRPSRSSRL